QRLGVDAAVIEGGKQIQRFPHRDVLEEIGGLKANSDALLQVIYLNVGVVPENRYVAFGATPEALEDLDSGGLAGSVRPEQAEYFALIDFEVDAANSLDVAVALLQCSDGNCGISHVDLV